MTIRLKRAYERPAKTDGQRVLVERLWPRGLTRERARIDLWLKEAAPSTELRRWFGHDPAKWAEFRKRYFKELDRRRKLLAPLFGKLSGRTVTFVFASRETRFNNAVALREYILNKR